MRLKILTTVACALAILSMPAIGQDAGFGDNIPLGMAVKQIVPQDHVVELGPGVDESVRVSWNGKAGWISAIQDAAAGAGYVATVTGTKVMIVKAGTSVEKAAPAASTAEAPPAAAAPASTPPKKTPPKSAPKPPTPPETVVVSGGGFVLVPGAGTDSGWQTPDGQSAVADWVVAIGDDLQTVLESWAAVEGWRVVWESEYVYDITSPARFRGNFMTATAELFRGMQAARPMLTAKFFEGNKVLVVANDATGTVN